MDEDKSKLKEISRISSGKENSVTLSCQNPSSSSSVKVRKSSNIFSALVRKARRKKTCSKSDGIKNLHISSQNLSYSSTLSLPAHIEEEVEISCQNYDKKSSQNQGILWDGRGMCSETNTSNHSGISLNKTGNVFNLRNPYSGNQAFKDDAGQTEHHQLEGELGKEKGIKQIAVCSFINFQKPILNVAHADALQYLQELINYFHDNEHNVLNLLVKYITDHDVQKEITNAFSNHTKLQWEAERRSCSLANDIWVQQLEIGRAQEKILQNTLQSLVKQNRQLQIENESLYRKSEKANRLLKGYSDHKSGRYQDCDSQLDSILRHNEKLQTKLETLFKKIESLEGELQMFQKQNDHIEEQLRNSTVKIQRLKAALHKTRTEYEIEQVSLNFKLESKEQVVKEAFEIGNIVLEDLDNLKQQLKNLPFSINWTKFNVKTQCLTDLIHVCRSCINELSKELITSHSESTLKDKDISTLRESNKTLRENLKQSMTELESYTKKIQEASTVSDEKRLLEQKCQILENELTISNEKIEKLKSQHDNEKSNLFQRFGSDEKVIKELEEKDKMIEQTKLFVANITSENYSLQNEIVMLNRIIKETGAGDVIREIEHTQKQLEFSKKGIEGLRNENTQLRIQIVNARNEHNALINNQELTQDTFQRQLKELERLNNDNQDLRKKVDLEHQTVLSLQNERMKYLEEKNILKSIIQHLRGELSKIRQLEENLSNVSKEASKLGLIAEYNKQQGEKLKQDVIERDNTISQLKSSMHKLNEVQMKNAKEKISLCYELNEVSQLKEKLNEVLNTEQKKNAELGQSKDAIVQSVNSQIQKFEEKQKQERTAMRILLKDLKSVAEEKENVAKEKNKLELETEQLKLKLSDNEEKYENLIKDLSKKNDEMKDIRNEIDSSDKRNKELNYKLENETSKYEMNVRQLKKLIEQLRDDKKHLECNNEYLKNKLEKVHTDLKQSQESEKLIADTLNRIKQEQEEAKQYLNTQAQATKEALKEKEKFTEEKYRLITEKNGLIKENECLNTLMDKVVNDFEKSLKTSEEKEKLFKDELDEAKQIIYAYGQEVQEIKQELELKDKKLEDLKKMGKMDEIHEKRYIMMKGETSELEKEIRSLKGDKVELETQLIDLQEEYNKMTLHNSHLEKETNVLESQLKIVLDQKEEDYLFYKRHIAEISKSRVEQQEQNQKEIKKLRTQLQEATSKLTNEKNAYETLSQMHKDVSGKFMKSIKDLVDVKNSKQDVLERIKEDKLNLENMENEKRELCTQIKELTNDLEKSNFNFRQKNDENLILQSNYAKYMERCIVLEKQIKQMEEEHQQTYQKIMSGTTENNATQNLQVEMEKLRNEIEANLSTIHRLRMEIAELQKQIILLELDRSEITSHLQETEKKLETEKNLGEQLKNTQKLLLAAVMQLRDEGKVDSSDCIHILHMARSSNFLGAVSLDGAKSENSKE